MLQCLVLPLLFCVPFSKCKEVRCKHINFADGYGMFLDRSSGQCYNQAASIVVMITGACAPAAQESATSCNSHTFMCDSRLPGVTHRCRSWDFAGVNTSEAGCTSMQRLVSTDT